MKAARLMRNLKRAGRFAYLLHKGSFTFIAISRRLCSAADALGVTAKANSSPPVFLSYNISVIAAGQRK